MKFYKYCGAGNDFVLLENLDGAYSPKTLSALAKRLCERRFCVGADGLIVVERAENGGDCKMRFFNNDGSAAEMCGNGARCLCRHCHDFGLSGAVQQIETPAGIVRGTRISENQYRIRLNPPTAVRLQCTASGTKCDYLELGEGGIPHAVVLTDLSAMRSDLRSFAQRLRHAPEFPRGANVNLCQIVGENTVRLFTYERGVEDFTLACGTGAGSTVAALTLRGLLSGEGVRVLVDGGELTVDAHGDDVFLTGPAERVFIGELEETF